MHIPALAVRALAVIVVASLVPAALLAAADVPPKGAGASIQADCPPEVAPPVTSGSELAELFSTIEESPAATLAETVSPLPASVDAASVLVSDGVIPLRTGPKPAQCNPACVQNGRCCETSQGCCIAPW